MKENQLPKYFVVKQDLKNPLWGKYIKWLNETYGSFWTGRSQGDYYGFDGNRIHSGTNCWPILAYFQNSPTLLTIEQWDAIVNPKELKVGDKVELHGLEYEVFGTTAYWLSNLRGENGEVFYALCLDKKKFAESILGYYDGGQFPCCKTLADLTKLVNALKNYKPTDTTMTEKTYEVTREQMGKIHEIACESWKTKINSLVDRHFGKYDTKANLSHSEVKEMMAAATDKQKPVLKEIFPTYSEQSIIPKGELAWVRDRESQLWDCRYSDGEGRFYINQMKSGDTTSWKQVFPYNQRPF